MRWLAMALVASALLLTHDAARAEAYIWAYGSPIQAPGHPVVFNVDTDAGTTPVVVELYRIPVGDAARYLHDGRFQQISGTVKLALVARATLSGSASVRRASLDPKGLGYFLFVARAGTATYTSVVDVTSFAFARISVGGATLLMPTNMLTFNQQSGVAVHLQADGHVPTALKESSGLFLLPKLDTSRHEVITGAAADGSVSVEPIENMYAALPARDIGYVQTDRPIYRPGQQIDVRAIVRDGSIGSYTVPHGKRHLRVTAPDGSVIFDRSLELSSYGTVHAIVPLAADAQLGSYQLAVGTLERAVTVAAYKKPEYQISLEAKRASIVGSDRAQFALEARYFFGRPAAGMHLHYTAYKQSTPHWWYGPYEFAFGARPWFRREKIAEGDFATDAQGRHTVGVDTTKTEHEQELTLDVEGRDAAGRTVQTEATVAVTPASFALTLEPSVWFAQAGHALSLTVHARAYDQIPRANAHVHVTIAGTRYDPETQKELDLGTATVDVTTDAHGNAGFSWTPHDGGSYRFTATSPDERGFVATGTCYLWALGADDSSPFAPVARPEIIAEKSTFAPGAPAYVLVTLPKADRDIVLTTASDHLLDARVLHVKGTTARIPVAIPSAVSKLSVTVLLASESGISSASVQLSVAPRPKSLRIVLTPQKARYAPGERARFDVLATDMRGRPVRSELAIGVVDEAIYGLQEDDRTDPFDVFYGGVAYAYGTAPWLRPMYALKSVAASMESGIPAAMPAPTAAPMQSIAIRKNFQDSAYWSPSVVTNADGRAAISFAWPDNLTTWRATGIGVTVNTDIGRGVAKTLVTKDFLVRLETPRFLRAGDRSAVAGIAHGVKSSAAVRLELDAGALAPSMLDATLHLGTNDDASTTWPVAAPGVGGVMLTLRGSDGTRTDGTQSFLPLLGATAMEHERDAGALPDRSDLALHLPPGDLAGALHLTFAPSIVAQLVQSVRLFDIYPYYCTEQTASTALPAAMLLRVAKQYDLTLPDDVKPREILAHAQQRLAELRHPDGAWGWWESDASEPFMTAYAVEGLAQMRAALGKLSDPSMLDEGATALRNQLASTPGERLRAWGGGERGDEWNVRAFMLMALADAGAQYVDPAQMTASFDHLRELDPYGVAVLGLAAHDLHDAQRARAALAELDRRVTLDGSYAYWHGDHWDWAWTSDPIEMTAYALRLYTRVDPTAERIPKIVNFLRSQRRGDWWYTTKDSAIAAVAIAEALHPKPDELHPDETIVVKAGDRTIRTLHITRAILDAADAQVVVPASALQHGERITFERSGRGSLYWSSDWERYVSPDATTTSNADRALLDRLFAKPPQLSVARTYHAPHPGPWKIGDEIDVELTVSAREAVRYVAIEDPFPAGAEHQPLQGRAADDAWSGFQFLDDRATFFASDVGVYPLHLHYTLRVTTAGRYAAPPPDAFAMYGPPVSAVGTGGIVEVRPEP